MSTGTQIPATAPRTMGSAVAAAFLTAKPSEAVREAFSASCAKVHAAQVTLYPLQKAAAKMGLHLEGQQGGGFVLYGKGDVETFDSLEAVAVRLAA